MLLHDIQLGQGPCGGITGDKTINSMSFTYFHYCFTIIVRKMAPSADVNYDKTKVHQNLPEFMGIHQGIHIMCIGLEQF